MRSGYYRSEHEIEYSSASSSEEAFASLEQEASRLSHDFSSSLHVGGLIKLVSFDVKADYKYHQSVSRFSSYAKSARSSSSESFKEREKVILEVPHGQTLVFYQKCMSLMGIETCSELSSLPLTEFDRRFRNKRAHTEMEVEFMVEYPQKTIHCQDTGCYISMVSTSGAALNTNGVYGGGEKHQILHVGNTARL